jgi:hypothetical protein
MKLRPGKHSHQLKSSNFNIFTTIINTQNIKHVCQAEDVSKPN